MNRRGAIIGCLVAGFVAYLALRDRLSPISEKWAIGHSAFGGDEKKLYRVGKPGLFNRTRVDGKIVQYRFYPPDCVLYTSQRAADGRVVFGVCGDRTPLIVGAGDYHMNPYGIESPYRPDTLNGQVIIRGRRIPIGRLKAAAKASPAFDPGFVRDLNKTWNFIPETPYRFPESTEWPNYLKGTALHDAVASGDVSRVLALLSSGMYPDLRGPTGVTPLMVATFEDKPQYSRIVAALLTAGADPDAQSETGMTALMFAVRSGADNAATLIRNKGADTTLRNRGGQTASQLKSVSARP